MRERNERKNNLRKQRGTKEGSKAKKEGRELQCMRERKERRLI